MEGDLRRCVHEILEEGEDGEDSLWNELEIAVTHIVHEVNISYITRE